MRNHIAFKFLMICLATVFLLTTVCSALCIAALIGTNLYSSTVEEEYENQLYSERRALAVELVYTYATLKLGNIPTEYYEQYHGFDWKNAYFQEGHYYYSIFDENGIMVESTMPDNAPEDDVYEIELSNITYRCLTEDGTNSFNDDYFDAENERYIQVSYNKERVDDYTVQLYVLKDSYSYDITWQVLQQLYNIRYHLFWVFGAALMLSVITLVCLCCTAGRKPGTDAIRAGGINRLPLDLYTAVCGGAILLLLALCFQLGDALLYDIPLLLFYLLLLAGWLGCLILVGLVFAWAAQLKMKNRWWLKNTLVGMFFHWLGSGVRWMFRAMHSLFRLLPVIWQWLLTAALMVFIPFLFIAIAFSVWYPWNDFWAVMFLVALVADVGVILYGGYCFGALMKGATRMSRGELDTKISTKYLTGSFRDFALHLNALSDTISVAAERQMRSERMKTELITNVSHDIKTPLTSIINFVDLLQKPHSEPEQAEYLEVLSRQSAQMKKLIEDLMELSKASSGNLTVNLQKVDAVEAVNQALGEFSDKLESAGLTPVFRQPEHPVYITADGRHVWRVLFNLLTNAVKYALPGTRLYIDLMQADRSVVLSIKNVSRAELNISADELMERFVQGDASRKSEGSGLGLNIAKSLMEVQHGQLQLLLDGDLFKVTLIFSAAE